MKPSVDGSSSASENHAPEIRLTRITAQRPARLSKSFQMVGNVLTKKKKEWIAIAEGLLEYETLSGEEIKALIAGQKPARDLGDDTPPSRGSAVPKAGAPGGRRKKGEEPEGGMEPQPSS